jgi:hypothetical protein
MPALRALLPAVVALASLGTLTGGLTSAADLRADERRAEARAAERRAEQRERKAVAAYQQQLAPVAVTVYDMVQPLQQAFRDLDDGDVDAVDVVIDVGNHLAAPQALPAMRARLGAITPPRSVLDRHRVLLETVDGFAFAASEVKPLDDSDDESTYARLLARADLALDDATRDWIRPITRIYAGAEAPPVPVEDGTDGPRTPLSHASYLREAGNQCSAGIEAFDKTGAGKDEPSLAEVRAGLRELSSRISRLAKVKAPTADDKVVAQTIRAPLRRTVELEQGFNAAIAAAQRGDDAGIRAGEAQITRGEVAAEKAAAGYRAYGSQLCALYLVGLEEGAAAPEGDGTRTT